LNVRCSSRSIAASSALMLSYINTLPGDLAGFSWEYDSADEKGSVTYHGWGDC